MKLYNMDNQAQRSGSAVVHHLSPELTFKNESLEGTEQVGVIITGRLVILCTAFRPDTVLCFLSVEL